MEWTPLFSRSLCVIRNVGRNFILRVGSQHVWNAFKLCSLLCHSYYGNPSSNVRGGTLLLSRQAWKRSMSGGGGGGGGGGDSGAFFYFNIFGSISQTQGKGILVHHQPLWQASKHLRKKPLLGPQNRWGGGGDIWYYVPHLPNRGGPPPPPPPPPRISAHDPNC